MKKLYILYGLTLAGLLLMGILLINLSQVSNASIALKHLGKGDAEYQLARKKVLFMLGDPSPALYAFISKKNISNTARIQALRIMQELAFHQDMHEGGRYVAPLFEHGSEELKIEALKTIERMHSMEGTGPVISLYKSTSDTAMFRRCYTALKGAIAAVYTHLDSAMKADDTVYIDSVASLIINYPAAKGLILTRLSRYYSTRGDFTKASAMYRRLGIISKWWTAGEFVVKSEVNGMAEKFSPELQPFNPSDVFPTGEDGETTRWIPLQRINGWGDINIRNLFARQNNTAAYFTTYVISPDDRKALLFCQADDYFHIWLNDSLIWNEVFNGDIVNEQVIPVALKKGANRLMIKVYQGGWGWGLFCRLGGMDGGCMEDVAVSLNDVPVENRIDSLIDLAQGTPSSIDMNHVMLDAEDDHVLALVLNTILDNSQLPERRRAAIQVLKILNGNRRIPAGESELIDLAGKLGSGDRSNDLLQAAVSALIDMKTVKALDLGISLRKGTDPGLDYMGNMLINMYCKSTLIKNGDLFAGKDPSVIIRIVDELESLSPTDPWVVQRLAEFRLKKGEKKKAGKTAAPFAMNNDWIIREIPGRDIALSRQEIAGLVPCSSTSNQTAHAVTSWSKLSLTEGQTAETFGMYTVFRKEQLAVRGRTKACFMISTTFASDSACSAFVNITLPAPYALWVNGEFAGNNKALEADRYLIGDLYRWQRFNFDVNNHRTAFMNGSNTITIVFTDEWVTGCFDRFFRCGFSRLDGRPMVLKRAVAERELS